MKIVIFSQDNGQVAQAGLYIYIYTFKIKAPNSLL